MTSTSEPSEAVAPEAAPAVTESAEVPVVKEIVPDPVLLASREFAREALGQITDPHSIGSDNGHEVHEARVMTLYFECRLPGYPGWRWAATLTRVDENSPVTLLETELLPGDGAVVAPEWVPWSERLAQYRDAQAKQTDDEVAGKAAAQVGPNDPAAASDGHDIADEDDDNDDDIDDNDTEDDVDEDGFADIDEHDLHDDEDDLDDLGEDNEDSDDDASDAASDDADADAAVNTDADKD